MPSARQHLADLLETVTPATRDAAINAAFAEQLTNTAFVLKAGNPNHSPEFTEGVNWAVALIQSAANKLNAE